jgi:hypothetical protein
MVDFNGASICDKHWWIGVQLMHWAEGRGMCNWFSSQTILGFQECHSRSQLEFPVSLEFIIKEQFS